MNETGGIFMDEKKEKLIVRVVEEFLSKEGVMTVQDYDNILLEEEELN